MSTDNSTPETITIQLTRGQVTIVSAIDADVAKMRWYSHFSKSYAGGGRYIACVHAKTDPITKKRPIILLHRLILERVIGRSLDSLELCDHIDGDTLNNTRENLRIANKSQNNSNTGKRKTNKSGYKGVYRHYKNNRWVAEICFNGKAEYLGSFLTPEEAYEAYCNRGRQLHGPFFNPG